MVGVAIGLYHTQPQEERRQRNRSFVLFVRKRGLHDPGAEIDRISSLDVIRRKNPAPAPRLPFFLSLLPPPLSPPHERTHHCST
jgi:hypothetical protein